MNQERIAWTAAEARSAIANEDQYKLRSLLSMMKAEGTMSDEMILTFVLYACSHGRVRELALILGMTREVSPLDSDLVKEIERNRGKLSHPVFCVLRSYALIEDRLAMIDCLHADGRLTRRMDVLREIIPFNRGVLGAVMSSRSYGNEEVLKFMSLGAYGCERLDTFLMKTTNAGTPFLMKTWEIHAHAYNDGARAKYALITSRRIVLAILYGEEATHRQVLPRELWRRVMYKL